MNYKTAPAHRFLQWPPPRVVSSTYTEYPKRVYPNGVESGQGIVVKNADEERQAMGSLLSPEAVEPEAGEPREAPSERDQLVRYCQDTGIAIDRRWGIDKLKDAIARAAPRKAAVAEQVSG